MQSAILLPVIAGAAVVVIVAVVAVVAVRRRRRRSNAEIATWSVAADNTGKRNRLFSLPPLVGSAAVSVHAPTDGYADDGTPSQWDPPAAPSDDVAHADADATVPVARGVTDERPWWLEDDNDDAAPAEPALADATAARPAEETTVDYQ